MVTARFAGGFIAVRDADSSAESTSRQRFFRTPEEIPPRPGNSLPEGSSKSHGCSERPPPMRSLDRFRSRPPTMTVVSQAGIMAPFHASA
jgi:hypothetical protein